MANPDLWDGSLLKQPKEEKQPRRRSPKRRKGLPQKSAKKEVTDLIHDAYRDAFIFLARRYDDMNCWECGAPCKPSQLQLHHILRRGKGGQHKAFNYMLVCAGPGTNDCHSHLDGNDVRWTGRTA